MRILDKNNNELINPDYNLGYVQQESIFVTHHDAIEAVEEQGHWKDVQVYYNEDGTEKGKDVEWIVDVEGVEAKEAYDEYEDILRYIEYTAEEIEEIDRKKYAPTVQDDINSILVDQEYRLTLLELGLAE